MRTIFFPFVNKLCIRYTEMLKLFVNLLKKRKTQHNNPKEILQYAKPCLVTKKNVAEK